MSWVRLDDEFKDHPKIAAAGPCAAWLFVCGLCYCNKHLTDGFIPRRAAHALTSFEHVGLEYAGNDLVGFGNDVTCEWMAQVLCDFGLWELVDGGYRVHDYSDYQFTKAEVETMREQKREAGRKGGLARAKALAKAGAKASAQAESKPIPIPHTQVNTSAGGDYEINEHAFAKLFLSLKDADSQTEQTLRRVATRNRSTEGDFAWALECATGPGVESPSRVAVAELKKRGEGRLA